MSNSDWLNLFTIAVSLLVIAINTADIIRKRFMRGDE